MSKYLIGTSIMPETPNLSLSSYQGLQFNGQCVLDNIWVRNYIQTDESANIVDISQPPDWTPDILFRTVFNHTLDSANIFGMLQPQTKWNISRQEVGSSIVKNIGILEPNINSFIDYKVEGNKIYNYLISAQNNMQISNPLITDNIKTSFYGVYLLNAADIDNGSIDVEYYKFDYMSTVDKVSDNADITSFKNYTQYDNYSIGDRDFISGSVASLLFYVDDNNQVQWDADYLDKFRKFINNKQEKILKFKNGKAIRCITFSSDSESFSYDFTDAYYKDEDLIQPINVTFGFKETGKVE